MTAAVLALIAASFVVSWLLTLTMKHAAPRLGFVDKPGGRKIHANPKPLGGGVAIFWGIALPMLLGLLYVNHFDPPTSLKPYAAYWSGIRDHTELAIGLLLSAFGMHLLGLFDDRKALGPLSKLIVQMAITFAMVVLLHLRALTALDHLLPLAPWPSVIVTVLWITAITNAFNFLDNMDGLSAGVAAVCTVAFLVTALTIGQLFVAATLALLLGALFGFLCFNFSPASIFMGDSGSLVIGLVMGAMTVRTTYLTPGKSWAGGWYVILAPVIVLAVPLYDLIVVSIIRISRGKSPFQGDTNHFSHRLVARGMSKRTAVLCLYLVTAATAVAAILLPQVQTTFGAMLIFWQTVLILFVVALLEQHPLPEKKNEPQDATAR